MRVQATRRIRIRPDSGPRHGQPAGTVLRPGLRVRADPGHRADGGRPDGGRCSGRADRRRALVGVDRLRVAGQYGAGRRGHRSRSSSSMIGVFLARAHDPRGIRRRAGRSARAHRVRRVLPRRAARPLLHVLDLAPGGPGSARPVAAVRPVAGRRHRRCCWSPGSPPAPDAALGARWSVDYVGTCLAAPRAGGCRSPGHFAERHGLIIIIALGESIVAIGVGVTRCRSPGRSSSPRCSA